MLHYDGRYGKSLNDYLELRDLTITIFHKDGKTTYLSDNEEAVQAIIDSYDPLPEAQAEAIAQIKQRAASKRLEYVTQSAGKDAEYVYKAQEAVQFDLDSTVGNFMQARIDATGETATAIAAEWNFKAAAWKSVGATIAALGDKANIDISAAATVAECETVTTSIIAAMDAI